MNNLVGDVKANPRDFYRYINSQKKDTQGIPPLKRKNGKGVAQSDLEKAEEFNGQFTDVFSKNEHTQVPLLDRSAPFINDIAVSKDGVIKLLKGLKTLLHQGLSEPEFNGDLVYKFKKIVGRVDFSDQFRKIIVRYKGIGYNINIMRQSACLVFNPITVNNFASLFNCTPAGRASDSMMAPT